MTHINPSESKIQEQVVLFTPKSVRNTPAAALSSASNLGTSNLCTSNLCTSNLCTLEDLYPLVEQPCLAPFETLIVDFCAALSKQLLQTGTPELSALGYWLRVSNIKRWQSKIEDQSQVALGTVVHFAPANVDTMFAYSWICSLLMGNSNIVRLSSQDSPLKQQLLQVINAVYEQSQFTAIARRNVFVTYEHNTGISTGISTALSALADARLIWGGDATVAHIRSIAAKLRTRDICFADRYSVAVINGETFSDTASAESAAKALWRDMQPYSQMACSSPRTLFFHGCDTQLGYLLEALTQQALSATVSPSESMQTRQNDHLIASQLALATGAAIGVVQNKALTAVKVKPFTEQTRQNLYQWHVGDGFLYLYQWHCLADVINNLNAHCQTMSYYGLPLSAIIEAFNAAPITQIDRIVPLGQALDFSPVWDGYDLFNQLSRQVIAR